MSDRTEPIKPRAVPLSHAGTVRQSRRINSRRLFVTLFLAGAGVLVFALFVLAPQFVEPVVTGKGEASPPAGEAAPTQATNRPPTAARPDEPPPFEALLREQARTKAQDELARFVELEIELREAMQVETWAAEAYEAAKNLAHAGDESFVDERYAAAIDNYRSAADALEALIAEGHSRFDTALANALAGIDSLDAGEAERWLSEARLIKPAHPALLRAEARAESLPEIVSLFRDAHNEELSGQWDAALATYMRIRTLDPETPGLDRAMSDARQQRSAQRLQSLLSAGFAQLARGELSQAESSFRKALSMDPNNGAALGGLQQIAEQGLVRQVENLRGQAAEAEAGEDWPAAAQAFDAILALDGNIQFARAGITRARLQLETLAALRDIAAAAESLSSDRLYDAARETLNRARDLEPRGPVLAGRITEVEALLNLYANPVPVILKSDNATEVLLSNVGQLGKFDELQLSLRPGAYTLIGSRDGCRDVRATITVRTDMAPVDIRCREVLAGPVRE